MACGLFTRANADVRRSLDGCPKNYNVELLRALVGMLSRRSRLHLQSLAPINPHWWYTPTLRDGLWPVLLMCP
jgi:hypothetical protein